VKTPRYGFHPEHGRYPDGCDWHKPPGCTCKTFAQAQGCYEMCYQDQFLDRPRRFKGFARWLANVIVALFILLIVLSIVTKAANGANLPVPAPLPKARINPNPEPHALPPVVIDAAPVKRSPWYCKPLLKFERSCVGVKAAAATLGATRAKALAIRCGATAEDIAQAEACLK
jgi:hypothetical protein